MRLSPPNKRHSAYIDIAADGSAITGQLNTFMRANSALNASDPAGLFKR